MAAVDLEVFGAGLDRYEHGFAEALDLALRWLTSERVGGDGERFRFREVDVMPLPATRPRPPVVVAATSEATVDVAAARGLPLLLGMDLTDERRRALVARWAGGARRHGHDPASPGHVACALAQVADRREDAEGLLRTAFLPFLERGVNAYVPVVPAARPRRDLAGYLEHLLAISPVGTPAECAQRVSEIAACGVDHVILMVEGGGERQAVLENVARLGAEVLPELASRA